MSSKDLMVGVAHGGPLDGRELISRCPEGVIVIDKPHRKVWIYDWTGQRFAFREERVLDDRKHYKAARESDYDVLAAPDTPSEEGVAVHG